MPDQVIPITDLAAIGLVQDTPSMSLPPNAFTNCQNVRFSEGAVRKMAGEKSVLSSLSNVKYVAYWPGPTTNRYVVIRYSSGSSANVDVYDVLTDNTISTLKNSTLSGTMSVSSTDSGNWQHTLFNGGFQIILNNGTSTPTFIQEGLAGPTKLPGWDSYLAQENVVDLTYNPNYADFPLGRAIDFSKERIVITHTPRDSNLPISQGELTTATSTQIRAARGTTYGAVNAQYHVSTTGNGITLSNIVNFSGVTIGDRIQISIQKIPAINVTASIVRAYGNLLVAGNLLESARSGGQVQRRMTGVIRTSDVAAPGSMPTNWNPFFTGVNTADEFTLASTGIIRDMVELQGVLYVYTDSSIHAIQHTNNVTVPFQISPVTDAYGAIGIDSVLEVDGKHIVVGSDDIYVFAGHPGSITSIANGKVRYNTFFSNKDIRVLRFNKHDELWFYRSGSSEIFIWNYRNNTWTRRVQSTITAGTVGHDSVYFATTTSLLDVDKGYSTTESFVQKDKIALTPEFNTESIHSFALLTEGTGSLDIRVIGTDKPGEAVTDISTATANPFTISTDYKQDVRLTARFLTYKITHSSNNNFSLSGIQLQIGKGGQR